MQFKYAHNTNRYVGTARGPGRAADRAKWPTGPDPLRRDKYYAWLKHRAQAKFRNEPHTLTWDFWESVWPDHVWLKRGRGADDLCLAREDFLDGWHDYNVDIVTRRISLARQGEYKRADV